MPSPTSARTSSSPARRPARSSRSSGATKVLCPIQEANNIGLQERCDGAADTFGNVENLQLSAGLADLSKSQAEIQAKLEADPASTRCSR